MKLVILFMIFVPLFIHAEEKVNLKNYTEPHTGLIFPQQIESYTQNAVTEYPDKKDGVAITYNGYGYAQFFVYDAGFEKISTGITSDAFKEAFQTSVLGLENVLSSGEYSNGEALMSSTPNIKMENKEANLAVVVFTSTFKPEAGDTVPVTSWILMTGYKNKFLKLLFTHKGDDFKKSQEEIKVIIGGLLSANPEGIGDFFVEQNAP